MIVEIIGQTAIAGLNIEESLVSNIVIEEADIWDSDINVFEFNEQEILHLESSESNIVDASIIELETNEAIKPRDKSNLDTQAQKKTFVKKDKATTRLDQTLQESNKMHSLCRQKIEIKGDYYKKKLSLMEREVVAKENIASELKTISRSLKLLVKNVRLQ